MSERLPPKVACVKNRNRTNTEGPTYYSSLMYNAWWKNAVTAQDQLRQKMTFALSEILVSSIDEGSPLYDNAQAVSDYYDTLAVGFLDPASPNNQVHPVVSPVLRTLPGITGYGGSPVLQSGAFGNFRDILVTVTLHPAMGRYLDGRVSAVVGTHTHVTTADEQIFPGGTAYITDLGMTGPHDGVIGMKAAIVLERFLTGLNARFEVSEGDLQLNGLLIEVNEETGRATRVQRLNVRQTP